METVEVEINSDDNKTLENTDKAEENIVEKPIQPVPKKRKTDKLLEEMRQSRLQRNQILEKL